MHPDAQTDESVRRLAEMQMRRLNLIVETLTDDEKRRQYDREIKPPPVERLPPHNFALEMPDEDAPAGTLHLALRIWKAVPWWVWSTAGALTLSVGGGLLLGR